MKIIAFYLPQFHTFPENDEWWGKGFTEWTNTKKAKPLFNGHYQPHIPMNGNYYDLSTVEPMREQAKIAKEYGVDAFCFYHYWFKDGKMLMEKPVERFLNEKSIDIEFCLSWANEPWTRAWDGSKNQVIMPQEYGSEQEWKKHFEYFLKFFCDQRYIKIGNKPLLLIYRPDMIEKWDKMLLCWNQLARQNGFDGLAVAVQGVGACANFDYDKKSFDYIIEFEPLYTNAVLKMRNLLKHPMSVLTGIKTWRYNSQVWKKAKKQDQLNEPAKVYDYDLVCEAMTKRPPYCSKLVPGISPSWDNTPRRGINAMIFSGSTPEKFKKYLKIQLKRAKSVYRQEMLFINAWNEWAEGAHLEPDEKYGYAYLEAIKEARKECNI